MSNSNYILNRFPIRVKELDRFKYCKKWYKIVANNKNNISDKNSEVFNFMKYIEENKIKNR